MILCAIAIVAGCDRKSEQTASEQAATDTKSSTAPARDAITTAEGPIKAGANFGTFKATSPTALKLAKGTTLTATPEGMIVAFSINDGTGGSIRCQRDAGCTGACTWETTSTDATCSDSSEGAGGDAQTCACSWHFQRPVEGVAEAE
jgi:hypothetical protein